MQPCALNHPAQAHQGPILLPSFLPPLSYIAALVDAFLSNSLVLQGTDLHHLPLEVLRLTALTSLDIGQGNQLLVLPPTLTILQELLDIVADENRLFYVHPELGKMAKLRQLSIKNNVLETLPHELSAISTLKTLKYSGNPLTGPPEGTLVSIRSLEKIKDETPESFEPWMDRVLALAVTDAAPEATLVYLQVRPKTLDIFRWGPKPPT